MQNWCFQHSSILKGSDTRRQCSPGTLFLEFYTALSLCLCLCGCLFAGAFTALLMGTMRCAANNSLKNDMMSWSIYSCTGIMYVLVSWCFCLFLCHICLYASVFVVFPVLRCAFSLASAHASSSWFPCFPVLACIVFYFLLLGHASRLQLSCIAVKLFFPSLALCTYKN